MKKKLISLILLLIGAVFIILGIVVPNTMYKNKVSYEYEKHLAGFDDKFSVTITAGKKYDIDSAVLFFENSFGDDLEVTVDGSKIQESKKDNQYIYTFEVVIKDGTVSGIISSVDELTLNTSAGEIEVEYDKFQLNSGHIAIRIIFLLLAGVSIVIGIGIIFIHKGTDKYVNQIKKQMQAKYPEVNTSTMTDEEIIAEWEKLNADNSKQTFLEGLSNIINPKKKYVKCEYCGTDNDMENTKCTSCGGGLNKK